MLKYILKTAPDLGEKPTVRAIRDQMRKLAADKKPKAAATKSGFSRAATKTKKRALDDDNEAQEGAAQEDDVAESGAVDDVGEPEPVPDKQKRQKFNTSKKFGGKKV